MFSFYFYRLHHHLRKIQAQRLTKEQKGVSAIEFAIVFPLFIAVIVATIELFWQLFAALVLQNAAIEAARYVQTGSTSDPSIANGCVVDRLGAAQSVAQWSAKGLLLRPIRVSVEGGPSPVAGNNTALLVFTYTQPYFTYWGRKFLGYGKSGGMLHRFQIPVDINTLVKPMRCVPQQ